MNEAQSFLCKICGEPFNADTRSMRDDAGRTYEQLMTEVSYISGRSLCPVISNVFPQDAEIQQFVASQNGLEKQNYFVESYKNQGTCGTCYNLLEQVEAFMMNLNRSKSDLFHRRKVHQERELDSLPIKGSSMNSHENYIFGKQLKSRNNLDPQNKSIKRAELLSQLPSSTKVSTVLVVEPTSSFPIKNKVLPNTIIDSLQSTGENISEDETTDIFSYTSKEDVSGRPTCGREMSTFEENDNIHAMETYYNNLKLETLANIKTESSLKLHDDSLTDAIENNSGYENEMRNAFDVAKESIHENNGHVDEKVFSEFQTNPELERKKVKIPRKKRKIYPPNLKMGSSKTYKKNVFITCEHCGKKSRGEKFHAKHLFTTHGVEKKVECRQCRKECLSIRDLDHHRRTSHIVATCELCARPFYNPADLGKHLKNVHQIGQKEDEFICELCAQSFQTKQYLRVHMRVHRDRNIKCTLCDKAFRWESGLKSHMAAAHSQLAQLYNCEFCGKQFKDKGNWKSHRYTHLDHKPHSCSKCGRGFIRKDMLLTHEKNCRI